jgi:hypothetical protein
MRNSFIAFSMAIVAISAQAARRVTIKQIDQSLTAMIGSSKTESDILQYLTQTELTERMSTEDLNRWKEKITDKASSRALTLLADKSTFLNPPADEIPKNPPLDKEAQQKLIASASDYIDKTISKFPNFFATEAIMLFENTPPGTDSSGYKINFQPMHYESTISAKVLYRNGKEIMESAAGQISEDDQVVSPSAGLLSSGQFGPVLKTVFADAGKGKLIWSHWESRTGQSGEAAPTIAVFRYSVPRKESHYRIKVELAGASKPRSSRPGYHGEIALDPASGTVLRLTLHADASEEDSLSVANMMVEYGPVVIGGRTYICPTRSIAVVSTNFDSLMNASGASLESHESPNLQHRTEDENHQQTLLNDVVFEHYHLLRSEAKILTPADINDDGTEP